MRTLEARVLAAERHLRATVGYRVARLVLGLGAAVHFVVFVIVIPASRLRSAVDANQDDPALIAGAYLLILASVGWGSVGTVQLWLRGRLALAGRFPRSAEPGGQDPVDQLILWDVEGAVAASSLAPAFVHRIRARRSWEDQIERELDNRLGDRAHPALRVKRTLLRVVGDVGVGVAFLAGIIAGTLLCGSVPDKHVQDLGPVQAVLAACGVAVFMASVLGYATYHALRSVRRAASLNMLVRLDDERLQQDARARAWPHAKGAA